MKELRVSDHAVLRYMERVQGFDVEAVRQHIEKLCAPAASAGATTLRAEGVKFELSRAGVVTTVVPNGSHFAAARQERCGLGASRG